MAIQPPSSPLAAANDPGGKTWRIAGMKPAAVEAARASARRAGVPLATWLGGLIEEVAAREAAAENGTRQDR